LTEDLLDVVGALDCSVVGERFGLHSDSHEKWTEWLLLPIGEDDRVDRSYRDLVRVQASADVSPKLNPGFSDRMVIYRV